MSEKILFVGGPLDGQRQHLPQGGVVRTFVQTSPEQSYSAPPRESLGFAEHTYHIRPVGQHYVMFHSSIEDPCAALVKGYKRWRKPLSPIEKDRRRIQRMCRADQKIPPEGRPPYTHSQLMNHGR